MEIRTPRLDQIRRAVAYVLTHFTTPIVFFLTFRWFGAKPAISVAMTAIIIQIFFNWIYGLQFSPFFVIAAVFTLAFGGMDLFIKNPTFYRFEPFVQNFVVGTAFLVTLFREVPLLTHFVLALPARLKPDLSDAT